MNTSKIFGVTCVAACGVVLTACNGLFGGATSSSSGLPSSFSAIPTDGSGAPFLDSKVQTGQSAAPVVGGTLLVTRDKKTIVAADPDRDAIFLVDTTSHAVTPIQLQRGDEPGRVAEGPDGTVYVGLRRAGALVAVDVASGSVAKRVPVCGSPRGVAYDATSASVYVACRSGLLLTLAAGDLSIKRSLTLDPDLRDVIVRDQDLVVTRFQSAEVMVVGPDGTVSRRATPQPTPGCATATVLFRALALPGGQIALAHQVSSDDMVNENNGGYGMSSCGGGLVSRVFTTVDVDTPSGVDADAGTSPPDSGAAGSPPVSMTFQSTFLPSAGPLDVAVDADSGQLALIGLDTSLTGNKGSFEATGPAVGTSGALGSPPAALLSTMPGAGLWLVPLSALTENMPIIEATASVKIAGQPVAVAFNSGSYVVQSREPATLEFQDGSSVILSSESHADTGHLIFHMDSGIGISCSSCHPEGGEDGHVWHFPEGLRRTLPLQGGVLERAPFHWDGSLKDMNALFDEVMVKRMNVQASMSDPQIASLGSFLEQLPEPAPADGLDAAAVARGQVLFQRADVGCSTCHSGPQYTNNLLSDVGTGGQFVTPSLLGVGLRTALFHDGCAKSVADRFGPCAGTEHGKPELLSDGERADLITFLRSL
jgi:YVTN family beta-propeller protein